MQSEVQSPAEVQSQLLQTLRADCAGRLAPYKLPSMVSIVIKYGKCSMYSSIPRAVQAAHAGATPLGPTPLPLALLLYLSRPFFSRPYPSRPSSPRAGARRRGDSEEPYIPNQVRVVPEIPKNAMGKINKKGLLHLFDEY